MARRRIRTNSSRQESDDRVHLLVASRAAMRGLVALYSEPDNPAVEAEAYASETLCLIGLTAATEEPSISVDTRALVELSFRVLASWAMSTRRAQSSIAFTAALGVRHAVDVQSSKELTDQVRAWVGMALEPMGSDLAKTADRAAEEDDRRARIDGITAASNAPLWPEPLADLVEQRLLETQLGTSRLSAWYGMATRGGWNVARKIRRAVDEVVQTLPDQIGPFPGETAVYFPAQAFERLLTGRRGARPDAAQAFAPAAAADDALFEVGSSHGGAELAQSVDPVINTAFVTLDSAGSPLSPTQSLRPGQEVLFSLWHGVPDALSIELTPRDLPTDTLPAEATLTVAVFGFDDGLTILSSAPGVLQLSPSGYARVSHQPDDLQPLGIDPELLESRLFFRLKTPDRLGSVRLRCNIYFRQVLVQSRLITAQVGTAERSRTLAMRSELDYNLTRSLRGDLLEQIGEHQLSVMLNGGENGTHQFRVMGKGLTPYVSDATFTEGELQDVLRQARGALRRAAWGTTDPWSDDPYRYERRADDAQLREDLIALAVAGYRFYDTLVERLSKRHPQSLADLVRSPALVQFTARRSASELVPSSLIYDRPLDTGAPHLTLCPAFVKALEDGRPLAGEPCFLGACPWEGVETIVCPGGFWGFRHYLGTPVSQGDESDVAAVIDGSNGPAMSACFFPGFAGWPEHNARLSPMFPGAYWQTASSREEAKRLLQRSSAHVVYFYCHGGLKGTVPYILVDRTTGITRDNIRAFKWDWRKNRPLVFINGCQTTALEPSHAFDLVTGFVETAHAAGVIGTEITVFEQLASAFAEHFMRSFVQQRRPLGESVRSARLELLRQRNPLGLAYVPFALASLRLES